MMTDETRCALCTLPESIHRPDEGLCRNDEGNSTWVVECKGVFLHPDDMEEYRTQKVIDAYVAAVQEDAMHERAKQSALQQLGLARERPDGA